MKKCLCFFCDISGTIHGKISNSESVYQEFNRLLMRLKQEVSADYILFSLISSDSSESVMEVMQILHTYFDSSIVFGRQFFDQGYFEQGISVFTIGSGKPYQMSCYLKQLEKEHKIEKIYYADDCVMFHELFFFFAEDNHWDDKVISLIPKENLGLMELNKLLNEELMKSYSKDSKKERINVI